MEPQGLRRLASVFTVTAWLALAIGVIGAIGVFLGGAPDTPRPLGAVVLLVSGLYFCLFVAFGGIIRILLKIEEQTRRPSTPS